MDADPRNLAHLNRLLADDGPSGGPATGDETYDLAGAVHDGSARNGPPVRSYVVCSSPRCGSTLLAEGLYSTGRLGSPIEYFDPTNTMAVLWDRWRCSKLSEYLARLHRHRCSPAGVFGMKVHWFQIESLTRLDGGGDRVEGAAVLLDRVAPRARCIRLTRQDRTRQALSWARAERTEHWLDLGRATTGEPVELDISDTEIEEHENRLAEEDRCWSAVLDRLRAPVLDVTYEQLAGDVGTTVATVAAWLGCPAGPQEIAPPRLRRQSTEATEQVVDRYRRSHGVSV